MTTETNKEVAINTLFDEIMSAKKSEYESAIRNALDKAINYGDKQYERV